MQVSYMTKKSAFVIAISLFCANLIDNAVSRPNVKRFSPLQKISLKKFNRLNHGNGKENFSYCSSAKLVYHTSTEFCQDGLVKKCVHACEDKGFNLQIPVHLLPVPVPVAVPTNKSGKQEHPLTCRCQFHCHSYAKAKGIKCHDPNETTIGRGDGGEGEDGLGRDTTPEPSDDAAPNPPPEPESSTPPWVYMLVAVLLVVAGGTGGVVYGFGGSRIIATCKRRDRVGTAHGSIHCTSGTQDTGGNVGSVQYSMPLTSDLNGLEPTTPPNTARPHEGPSSSAGPDGQAGEAAPGSSRHGGEFVLFTREGDARYPVEAETNAFTRTEVVNQPPAVGGAPHQSQAPENSSSEKVAFGARAARPRSTNRHRSSAAVGGRDGLPPQPGSPDRAPGVAVPLLAREDPELQGAVGDVIEQPRGRKWSATETPAFIRNVANHPAADHGNTQAQVPSDAVPPDETPDGTAETGLTRDAVWSRSDVTPGSTVPLLSRGEPDVQGAVGGVAHQPRDPGSRRDSSGGSDDLQASRPGSPILADPRPSHEEPELQGAVGDARELPRGRKRSTTERGKRTRSCEPRLDAIEEEERAATEARAEDLRSLSLADLSHVNLRGEEGQRGRAQGRRHRGESRPVQSRQDPFNATSFYMVSSGR